MALQKLQFRPGINRNTTNYSNEGGWFECDKVRFVDGFPEKIKGWQALGSFTLVGIARALFNYNTSFDDNILAIGTNNKVFLEIGQTYFDITPTRSNNPTLPVLFDASANSTSITVTATAHGTLTGDFVTFSGASALGGNITADVLNQNYEITKLNDDSYSISATATANSSDTGDGGPSATGTYDITAGAGVLVLGYGWGTDSWNVGAWDEGSLLPIDLPITRWFFDNLDNDLIMNVNTSGKGAIFYWERGAQASLGTSVTVKAKKLSSLTTLGGVSVTPKNVPAEVGQIIVSQVDRHLIAFGATPYDNTVQTEDTGEFDPLLIRFADQDNVIDFRPDSLTKSSAGFLRVSSGTRIIAVQKTRQEMLVFTDSSVHSMQFLGFPDIFGLQELEHNASCASPRCVVASNNIVFWMGTNKFYYYDGRVNTLPCSLRDYVFNDINFDLLQYIYAGTVEEYNEIWWFYPSKNSSENDSYIVYNYKQQIWYYGSLDRTAWLDSSLRQFPVAADTNLIYMHENGLDANGSAMSSFIISSDFDITDGDRYILTNRILPDLSFLGSTTANPTVQISIAPRNFSGSARGIEESGNVVESSVDQYTEQVFIRARARQIGFKISSDSLGTTWKLGSPRLDGRPDGRRS